MNFECNYLHHHHFMKQQPFSFCRVWTSHTHHQPSTIFTILATHSRCHSWWTSGTNILLTKAVMTHAQRAGATAGRQGPPLGVASCDAKGWVLKRSCEENDTRARYVIWSNNKYVNICNNDAVVGKWEAFYFNFTLIRGHLQLTGEKCKVHSTVFTKVVSEIVWALQWSC